MEQVTVNKHVQPMDLADTMSMARARAYYYQKSGWHMFELNELVSAAYEGIAEALLRYEPSKGTVKETKFSSYAYFWIEKYLKAFITVNKTMVSGTGRELYTGMVGYTGSIDSFDDKGYDGSGSDHKFWLADSGYASDAIEHSEATDMQHALLQKMLRQLSRQERIVISLSLGIGTVDNEPMPLPMMAKSLRMSKPATQALLDSANAKLRELGSQYIDDYNDTL